ncbi:MAG: FtsW/RodA/SpoVE family cell cycle protein [Oscillibacter sp.]|nr:FtsW/RodA/SpoVE family cell cycle protein [Oscillibacter sp.]
MFNRSKNLLEDFFQQADLVLLGLCAAASLYGLLLITSATRYMGSKALRLLTVQCVALVLGIAIYILLSLVDVEVLLRKWKWILLFNIGFICLLRTPFGVSDNTGNRAWLKFPGVPVSIQPAEIVKITFILLLAKQLEWAWQEHHELKSLRAVLPPAFHLIFMVGLIYAVSNDMGSALVYAFIFACMAMVAGMAWRWFVVGIGLGGLGMFGLYKLGRIDYMIRRFRAIFDHTFEPLGVGWQQTRGLLALGSGGWFGQGLFHGTQTQSPTSTSLPARHTDFIFAVAGEELGLVGCIVIILLLAAIIVRCLQVARHARSQFSSYVCVGIAGMLIFQTIENLGMCLFVMPVIGLTLPFFSYGGSSLVTLFAAMGVVSGIKKRALPDRVRPR